MRRIDADDTIDTHNWQVTTMASKGTDNNRSSRLVARKVALWCRNAVLPLSSFAMLALSACGTPHAPPPIPRQGTVANSAQCPWIHSNRSIAWRVAAMMSRMSRSDEIRIVEGHGTRPYVGDIPKNPKICMPSVGLEDGPNGVGDGMSGVTALPSGVALAATFSRRLAFEFGQVIGAEQAAKGVSVDLGPTVNIDRDPRWGREFESLSEDPYLAAQLVVPEIRGIQSQGTIAQIKHFAAYNQETNRNTRKDNAIVAMRALHEIYLPAFRAAVRRAAVGSIMCSYARVNGHFSCENRYLLTTVLRDEWDFHGFVTSDWTAVHSVSAAAAGLNLEEPGSRFFGAPLRTQLKKHVILPATLNTMVQPILDQMFRFNFFNHPRPASTNAVASTRMHRAIASKVAEAGTVLLKNEHHLLPLLPTQTIAIIGPAASAQVTYSGGGSAYVVPSAQISPLRGIEATSNTTRVRYVQGLPTNAELTVIPQKDLSRPRGTQKPHGSFSETLKPAETGTYIVAITNECGCYRSASLAIDGRTLINNPGTPPVKTYSAAVHLTRGHSYRLTIGGHIRGDTLSWATPSTVIAAINQAVTIAKSSQVAVVVVADDTESEAADRPNLVLPSAQNALISAVAKANPHTVVVVQAGAPISMPWLKRVPAVVLTWFSGQTDGRALANVLFGHVDPSGHLPVTFPVHLADVPAASPRRFPGVNGQVYYSEGIDVGYRWYDQHHIKPLFPFGFGLSYTHFRYSDLHIDHTVVNGVTPIDISARVTNVGRVPGADVAQLYLGKPTSTGEPPRVLVAFQRIDLVPGQSAVLHFVITPREEWWWHHQRWTESAGVYRVYIGDSSARINLPLRASYSLKNTIGGRKVTVAASSTFTPGTRNVVQVLLGTGGNEVLSGVKFSLKAPSGWQVLQLSRPPSKIEPTQAVGIRFAVTSPRWESAQDAVLYGTVTFASKKCYGAYGSRHDLSPPNGTPESSKLDLSWCTVRRHGGLSVLVGQPSTLQ